MNKIVVIGRITRDLEVKTTQSQKSVCSFTVAVDRKFKNANGEKQADFLSCVAWGQQAELLGKYFAKGSKIGIVGNVQSRSYDDANGKKVYVTEIIVDEIEFMDSKSDRPAHDNPPAPTVDNGFYPSMDDDTSVLPFDL